MEQGIIQCTANSATTIIHLSGLLLLARERLLRLTSALKVILLVSAKDTS